jgi:hypothetical protein
VCWQTSQLTTSFNTPASLQNLKHVSVADNANIPISFRGTTGLPSSWNIESQSQGSTVPTPTKEKARPIISHLQDMDDINSRKVSEECMGTGFENRANISRERLVKEGSWSDCAPENPCSTWKIISNSGRPRISHSCDVMSQVSTILQYSGRSLNSRSRCAP